MLHLACPLPPQLNFTIASIKSVTTSVCIETKRLPLYPTEKKNRENGYCTHWQIGP